MSFWSVTGPNGEVQRVSPAANRIGRVVRHSTRGSAVHGLALGTFEWYGKKLKLDYRGLGSWPPYKVRASRIHRPRRKKTGQARAPSTGRSVPGRSSFMRVRSGVPRRQGPPPPWVAEWNAIAGRRGSFNRRPGGPGRGVSWVHPAKRYYRRKWRK